jgi:hypothetical protein
MENLPMTNHTPGRWRCRQHRCADLAAVSPAGRPICVARAADARRIVACVNALDGISDEALTSGALAELLLAAHQAAAELRPMAKAYPPSRAALGRLTGALGRLKE